MKLKGIPIGVDDFKDLITSNLKFVDKSLFIKEIIDDGSKVKLITRPRRFGKTLNLSMLKYFFEKTDEEHSHLFKDLKIWQQGEEYQKEQGKYPVIYLTLKDVKKNNIYDCMESLKIKIAEEYKYHYYILESNNILDIDKEEFLNIANRKAGNMDYENSLYLLSKLLYEYHQVPVIILIDEYDTPINHAFIKGYYEDAINLMKGFLGVALKSNEYLKMGVITGIYRVAKESIFSDMNNLDVSSITTDTYVDKFGFVEQEVEELAKYYGLNYKIDELKNWYNGYVFGENTIIFNPWSVLNYIKYKKYQPYWVNTSSNDLIREILFKTDADTKKSLKSLIERKAVEDVIINTSINFRDIIDAKVLNAEVLWNFLIVSGYLKTEDLRVEGRRTKASVKIPNQEILSLYEDMIEGWFRTDEVSSNIIKNMVQHLVNGEIKKFEHDFRYLVRKTFGYFDVGINVAENFYHAFTLGLLVNLEDKYRVLSNKESGDGRPDVMIIPNDISKKGVVIEFKIADSADDATMQEAVDQALSQINCKNYIDEFLFTGIKEVIKIGIAFCGKNVSIGYEEYSIKSPEF